MGIKSLTQTIKKFSIDSIENDNLYKLSGKKVAVDASLIIYQQLLGNHKILKNKDDKIINHIIGLFYKIINYMALNIDLIFIFDGRPPENKKKCIQKRKEKSFEAKAQSQKANNEEDKNKYERLSIRLTKEMIDDIKLLLNYLGIPYIQLDIGEAEAYASELCRIGYVDYLLSEDMDSLVYGCPKLIRNCIDKDLKRRGIVSIFHYEKIIKGLKLTKDQFIDFCIFCGCDYCDSVPKVGNITALKLIQKYGSINEVIKNTDYEFPDNYLDEFLSAKENFLILRDKVDIDDIKISNPGSKLNIYELEKYLVNDININPKKFSNVIKKLNNIYKITN